MCASKPWPSHEGHADPAGRSGSPPSQPATAGCARRPASPPRRRGCGSGPRLMPGPQPATARNRAPGSSMATQAAARSRSRFAYAACLRRCQTSRPCSTLPCLQEFAGHPATGHPNVGVKPTHSGCPARTQRSASACAAPAVRVICGRHPRVFSLAAVNAARYAFCAEPRAPLGIRSSSAITTPMIDVMAGLYGQPRTAQATRHLITPPSFGSDILICRRPCVSLLRQWRRRRDLFWSGA